MSPFFHEVLLFLFSSGREVHVHIASTVCSVFFSLRSFREVSFKTLFGGTSGILVLFIHPYILFLAGGWRSEL